MSALKDSILSDTDEEDKTNYESMSNGDRLDELFFKGEGLTEQGEEFIGSINSYRNNLLSILGTCLLYTSPSPRDRQKSRMPSSA